MTVWYPIEQTPNREAVPFAMGFGFSAISDIPALVSYALWTIIPPT